MTAVSVSLVMFRRSTSVVEQLARLLPGGRGVTRIGCAAVPLQFFMPSIQAAGSSFAVEVSAAPVHAKDEIEGVITAQAYEPGGGLIVMPDVFNDGNRELIIALAARHRMPAIYAWREAAAAGGLMSYGASFTDAYRQAGIYAGCIPKGEKPGDLAVMPPTKFELVLNLKTAKALGLTVPDRLLALANEVID
jgi:putative ABC transport system substrate-binding protein